MDRPLHVPTFGQDVLQHPIVDRVSALSDLLALFALISGPIEPKILLELMEARTSERQGRTIDSDSAGSMEKKKQEGYF